MGSCCVSNSTLLGEQFIRDILADESLKLRNFSYMELLNGFKQLLIRGDCHSSIHRKFKVIAQEIFEIENLLKKYSIKVWK